MEVFLNFHVEMTFFNLTALVDSLGGDIYWSTGVSLVSDIPRKPHWPIKSHIFVNAGGLDAMDGSA